MSTLDAGRELRYADIPVTDATTQPKAMAFPHNDSLCEHCGYPLKGLSGEADCPECGTTIEESHPQHRTGPAWQSRLSFRNWWGTLFAVGRHPVTTFRTMRIDGGNLPSRLFLLLIACWVGVGWALFAWGVLGRPPVLAWAFGIVATKATLALTYLEAFGVTWISRRRGTRIPFRLAERVTAYASVGWLLAASVLAVVVALADIGWINFGALSRVTWLGDIRPAAGVVVFGLCMLSFEVLVWTGVQQVRYANAPASD